MRFLKTIFPLLFFTLISVGELAAQVFPVQVTTQLARPYSLYLSDYTSPGSDRLTVNVFLADPNRASLDIRMRLRIEGQGIEIETKPEFTPAPITLHGGVPLQLISSDLAEYFEPRNLNFSGISQRDYEQRGALPEGLYQFCFEVLEYNRVVKISNTSCAFAWLILNDPPLVNLPRDNEKIRIQSPQQVIFQWTPRHTGSPNAAFTTEYDFKLVEVWPSTRNPNDAILTSRPIYETTTTSTTLIYGAAETALEPGRRYAFQVKARSVAGVTELNLFKNNGLSQVSSFIYGDACLPPVNILATAASPSQFGVSWDAGVNQTGYSVRYRLASSGSQSNWYINNAVTTDATISALQPGTTYEYQVAANCGFLESAYSPVARVTTKSSPVAIYSCGLPPEKFDLDPSQLIDALNVGDIIKAGDYDVTLTKVSGGNGRFSGEGNIEMSYFKNAKVNGEFANIAVNKDKRMVSGVLNVTGAGVDVIPAGVMNLMDQLSETLTSVDSAIAKYESNLPKRFDENSFVAEKTIVLAGTATVFKESNGTVTVVDGAGNRQTIPAGTTAAVVDGSGKGYLVDKNGGIHATTAAAATRAGKREYNLTVTFDADAQQRYGFDAKEKKDALASVYDKLNDSYDVAWKSVAVGFTDPVQAVIGSNLDKSRIRFEQATRSVTAVPSGANQTLTAQGSTNGEVEGLLALYTPADATQKEQVLGQLNVISYAEIHKTVVVVPVNNNSLASVGTKEALEAQLNKIYSQAVVRWTVNFASDKLFVPGIEPFDDGGTGLLSNYTSHMKKVIDAYGALDDETYYLFLVNNPVSGEVLGYMPRSKNAGFIFVDKTGGPEATARTIAHELGHGAFNLHHTFEEPNFTLAKGSTDNVMDYPAGAKLYKFQWDKLRYPDLVVGVFESDSSGALKGDSFARPLLIYYNGDPFEIRIRRTFENSIAVQINYRGKDKLKETQALNPLSKYGDIVLAENCQMPVDVNYFDVSKDQIGFITKFGLVPTKHFLSHAVTQITQDNTKQRKHQFVMLGGPTIDFTLIDPATPFSDKVIVDKDVELSQDNSVEKFIKSEISDVTVTTAEVTLPANITLYASEDCDLLVTEGITKAKLTLTRNSLTLAFSPALRVKVSIPVPDAFWKSTTYDLKNARLSHNVEESLYFLDAVRSKVLENLDLYFHVIIDHSVIANAGYDPLKDKNLSFTFDQIQKNLKEDAEANKVIPCQTAKVNADFDILLNPILSSTFIPAKPIDYLEDGTGVRMNVSPTTVTFVFDGSVGKIVKMDDIKIKQVILSSEDGIALIYKNKPQVVLRNIAILPGGKVTVNDAQLVGDLAQVQALEMGLVGIFKLWIAKGIAYRTGRVPAMSSSGQTLTKSAVEVALEVGIRAALIDKIRESNQILTNLLGDRLAKDQQQNLDLTKIMGVTSIDLDK